MYTQYSYFKFLHPKNNFIPKLVPWLKQFRGRIIWTQSSLSSSYSRNQKADNFENWLFQAWFLGPQQQITANGTRWRGRNSGPGCKCVEALQVICCQKGRSVVCIDWELSFKEASKHESSMFTVKSHYILHLWLAVAQILPVRWIWKQVTYLGQDSLTTRASRQSLPYLLLITLQRQHCSMRQDQPSSGPVVKGLLLQK